MTPLPEGPVVPDRIRGSRLLQTFVVVAMLALIVIAMVTFG